MSPELKALLATPEGRKKVAASMVRPIRCGGCDYDPDGARVYIIGGKRMRPEEFEAYKARCRSNTSL